MVIYLDLYIQESLAYVPRFFLLMEYCVFRVILRLHRTYGKMFVCSLMHFLDELRMYQGVSISALALFSNMQNRAKRPCINNSSGYPYAKHSHVDSLFANIIHSQASLIEHMQWS